MCYLKFDKTLMTNLQEMARREYLCTNRSGAYASSTLTGCNTRKYHGLLVVPLPQLDDENHVLLSSLDETVIQHGAAFNLALHHYQGNHYSPKGHKYIRSFEVDRIPATVFRIGGVLLKKELLFQQFSPRLMVRYTLLEAHSPTKLQLRPFLAFRSVREFMHENGRIHRGYDPIENGIRTRLYDDYPSLCMQLSRKNEFVYQPDWYRGLDYSKERERGYEASEDLYVPGYFEVDLRRGDSVVFTAGLDETTPNQLKKTMEKELEAHEQYSNFYHSLVCSAHQFHVQDGEENYLLAGYPWFKCRARDLFIALPGLTLTIGEQTAYEAYMQTAARGLEAFMSGASSAVKIYEIEKPDVPLWAVWCVQQYAKATSAKACYEQYGALLTALIDYLLQGKHANLFVHENGLLYSNGRDTAVTWMNATLGGRPITPRSGYIVEFNALWYNALFFMGYLLREAGREAEAAPYEALGEKAGKAFKETFFNEYGYLLDYVDGTMADWSVRPNQLFAVALDYSPLSLTEKKRVLDFCTRELLTPKGIRSLSPKSGGYNPVYRGLQSQRDQSYHQGPAYPWLTGFYLEAYLRVYKMSGLSYIERQLIGFEEELFHHCVGTISELYEGNPPFSGRGATSFAINVAGILRALHLLERSGERREGSV